jgi:ABC-type proline/glycine betaine transport system permease subunit
MVVIAALVGANGLGVPVVRALNSVNTALGFESGFIIVVVAILLGPHAEGDAQMTTAYSLPSNSTAFPSSSATIPIAPCR